MYIIHEFLHVMQIVGYIYSYDTQHSNARVFRSGPVFVLDETWPFAVRGLDMLQLPSFIVQVCNWMIIPSDLSM